MLKNLKNILIVIGVLLLAFGVFKITQSYYQGKIDEKNREDRKNTIKQDSLRKVSDGYYKKLVADTNTIKDLRKIVDSLKIKADNPVIVTQTEFIPIPQENPEPAEESTYTDSTYTLTDYYPKEENYFIRYNSTINFNKKVDTGNFSFNSIKLELVVEENEGLYEASIKLPEYFNVNTFDIQSTPLEKPKADNFGWLVGAGYFNNLNTQEQGIKLNGGIRYKKFYLIGSAQTNSTVGAKFLIEF